MQRHSTLTFQLPSACCICYYIPSHSAWEGFVLALGGLLLPPVHKALEKGFRKGWQVKVHHGHLSGPIFTAYVSESAQHLCPSPWTSLWSLKIFSFSAKTLPNDSWLCCTTVSNWKQNSRHPAWDYCTRQNSMAAAPFSYSCTSACGISKLFTHQNSLMSVCSH